MSSSPPTSGQDPHVALNHLITQNQEQQSINAQLMAQVQQLQQHIAQGAHAGPPGVPQQHEAPHHSGAGHNLARSMRLSEFSGHTDENPATWLMQLETYFNVAGERDTDTRIAVAGVYLRRAALEWYANFKRLLEVSQQQVSWEQFKGALVARFRPVDM